MAVVVTEGVFVVVVVVVVVVAVAAIAAEELVVGGGPTNIGLSRIFLFYGSSTLCMHTLHAYVRHVQYTHRDAFKLVCLLLCGDSCTCRSRTLAALEAALAWMSALSH